MSSARHAVMRAPKVLTGWGYLPDLTPAHQVLLETGMNCRSLESRMKPVSGSSICAMSHLVGVLNMVPIVMAYLRAAKILC